jgi:hypothetical protein
MQFNDMIKIAYNWIGPRGPIWNTELPHIISFGSVSDQFEKCKSNHWWTDDMWRRYFLNRKEQFIMYPAVHLDHTDMFIYPFSITWRIPFNHYFLGSNGILEYGHVLNSVKHLVRMFNGFFLIDDSVEAHTRPDNLRTMHDYFQGHQIPLNKIIFLTGTMNAQSLYEEFCERNGIPNTPDCRMNVISYPSSYNVYHLTVTGVGIEPHTEPTYNPEILPSKLFLCWNRRHRQHRLILAIALHKAGLVDRSYYSMTYDDPESPTFKIREHLDHFNNLFFGFDENDAEAFLHTLPRKIDDITEINEMCDDRGDRARQFYNDSLISLVTETNWNDPEVTLTEKSFKPAKEKHPFIIVGAQHSLRAIKELGFKTFSDFWDESYDDIPNNRERLKVTIQLCKEIGTWDNNKILDFRRKVQPILEHNYNLLKIEPAALVASKIADIVNRNRKT